MVVVMLGHNQYMKAYGNPYTCQEPEHHIHCCFFSEIRDQGQAHNNRYKYIRCVENIIRNKYFLYIFKIRIRIYNTVISTPVNSVMRYHVIYPCTHFHIFWQCGDGKYKYGKQENQSETYFFFTPGRE